MVDSAIGKKFSFNNKTWTIVALKHADFVLESDDVKPLMMRARWLWVYDKLERQGLLEEGQ